MLDNHAQVLPDPGAEAKNQSQLLIQSIRAACGKNDGWIKFSEFMNIALYEPAIGYYSGGLQKFGEQGDFITAPEVSPLFGQCLAGQLAEVINNICSVTREKVYLLEFGAGSGILAADILLQLEKQDSLPEQYLIIELSTELMQRQKETIQMKAAHLLDKVQWLNELPDYY